MKGFMKKSAIVALIMIGVGLVISVTAGYMVGTDTIDEVVDSTTHGRVRVNLNPHSDTFGIIVPANDMVNHMKSDLESKKTDWPEQAEQPDEVLNEGYEFWFGEEDRINLGEEVSALSIRCGGCEIRQEISPDHNFYVESDDSRNLHADVQDGVLSIEYSVKGVMRGNSDADIIIYIPEEAFFEKVNVDFGAGELMLGEISAQQVIVNLGAGEIVMDSLTSDDCDVSVGAGEIDMNNMAVGNLKTNVGLGAFYAQGTIGKNVNLDCGMGDIHLVLDGKETEFDYEVEAAMGEVTIGDRSFGGLGQKQKISYHADKTMTVKCGMGEVEILFWE